MKKAMILLGFCLILTACGQKSAQTGAVLSNGYTVKDHAGFYTMFDCGHYAKQKIQEAGVEDLQETNDGNGYTASGNLKKVGAVFYSCRSASDPNAVFLFAVKV
jgi:hypothetical protein